jgi:hypothetical protein
VFQDKRAHDRAQIVLPVRVDVGGRTLQGSSTDISVAGVRILLPEELAFGTRVKVRVCLPVMDEESAIEAEVRWSQEGPEGRFVHGFQFRGVRVRETWALNQLVRKP